MRHTGKNSIGSTQIMNILFIHGSHKEQGGDTVYLNQLVKLLPEYDITPFLITIEKEKRGYSVGINVFSVNKTFHSFTSIAKINEFIKEFINHEKIDLIHLHTVYQPRITRNCLKLRPVVKTPHATDMVCPGTNKFFTNSEQICNIPFGKHCLLHAYTERCCSRSPQRLFSNYYNVYSEVNEFSDQYRATIVMSDFVKSECIKTGMNPDKIFTVPYFTPVVEPTKNINHNKRLLYVGRLTLVKGVHTMIEALAPLLNAEKDVFLDIIGDGPYRTQLEKLVSDYRLTNQVQFHKWKPKAFINEALSKCAMLIFPSIYPEAFGIAGIEAMMHAKPVIGFDVGGVSTWLKNNETGFLVQRGNISEMREKVEFLLKNATVYSQMCLIARSVALKEFSPKVHVKQLISVYQDAVGSLV
jgi:glycosyltransferase involved in cell wall biosynthesis